MAYPFAAAEVLTAVDLNAMIGAPTQNTQTGTTYTFGLADAGKVNTFDNASPVTATLPAQATVSWPANTVLPVLCLGAGTVTITAAAGVTINGTPLTLETSKGGSLVRTASNVWTFIPFSGGVEAANFTNAATGTYTDGGKDYKYVTFPASGELVVDQAGFADVLVIGGGGSGVTGGGGAGGHLLITNAYFAAATHTVTIGAGGVVRNNGIASRIGDYYSPAGGRGSDADSTGGLNGANGGSGGGASATGGAGISGIGNNGGGGVSGGTGGGGGAGSVGSNATVTNNGAAGGSGSVNSITGSAVTRSGGGGGGAITSGGGAGSGGGGAGSTGTGTAGTANTGGGGGGGWSLGGNGGSGVVIVRVVV